jgi:hypothetical protein
LESYKEVLERKRITEHHCKFTGRTVEWQAKHDPVMHPPPPPNSRPALMTACDNAAGDEPLGAQLMRHGVDGFSPSSWEPQEEGMMSTTAKFPSVRNQGLIISRKKPNSRR